MRGRTIALGEIGGAEAAALIEDGRLQDLLIAGAGLAPGSVLRGVVGRPMKGQGGALVTLPEGAGFLRQAKGRAPGDVVLVQVTGRAEAGKAPPLTDRPVFKSRHALVTPGAPGLNVSRAIRDEGERDRLLEIAHEAMEGSELGLILRSAAEGEDADEVARDVAAMRALAEQVMADEGRAPELLVEGDGPHALAWREWPRPAQVDREPGALERHDVLEALDALCAPLVTLQGGGSMWVEPTRALVAVDVNTGDDASPAAGLKANLAAVRELPRQLRLRGLGGQVVLDPAPQPKRDRRGLEQALTAALRADAVETTLVGWTPLGHLEMTRKRERVPLTEALGPKERRP